MHGTQCKSSQWRAESGWWNKCVSYHNFWSIRWYSPSPQIWSLNLIVGHTLPVNKIFILFLSTIMINLKLNPTEPISERRIGLCIRLDSQYKTGQKLHILPNWSLITSSQLKKDSSQIWNWERPNMPSLTVSVCLSEFTQRLKIMKPKQNVHWHWIWMRTWWQPQFQLHLVTISHCRWELGLLTSSAAIDLVWCCVWLMFLSVQTFCERQIYWMFPLFGARIDILFAIFICSLFRLWVTFKLLHHFGFVSVLILGYAACTFHTTDAKYLMFHIGWCKSLKQ